MLIEMKKRIAMDKFQECLDSWMDLDNYVYSNKYRTAFESFIEPKLEKLEDIDSIENLVLMTLHHECDNRRPYFKFDREKYRDESYSRHIERLNVKRKSKKTLTEEMMLDYFKRLATISEIIVSNSKCEMDDKETLKRIKNALDVNTL